METKQTTVKDILNDVINILNGIKIPMNELEEIGLPVGRAINGIKLCVEAYEKAEEEEAAKKAAASEQTDDGQTLELVVDGNQVEE